MIQVFYDKINTLFDGLEDDQKAEIHRQLTKKLSDEGIKVGLRSSGAIAAQQVPPSPAPKKKWGGKAKGVTYQEVIGYDPSQKSVITRLKVGGMPKPDHSHIADDAIVIVKHGYKPNDKYFVCKKNSQAKDWKFFGTNGQAFDTVENMVKKHDDFFEKWKDMADYCDNYFNS